MPGEPIFHICKRAEWDRALSAGAYAGSSQDREDGFIHFSTRQQIVGSAAKHRANQKDLVLLSVNPDVLGDALKWEAARDARLFPHLYGNLPLDAVLKAEDLPLGRDGHVFPPGFNHG